MKKVILRLISYLQIKLGIVLFIPFSLKNKVFVTGGNGIFDLNIQKRKINRLLLGKSYGIFFLDNKLHFFLTSNNLNYGYIFKTYDLFKICFFAIKVGPRLSKGCHQIINHNSKIYITNTYEDNIIILNMMFKNIGKINLNYDKKYKHNNSIHIDKTYIYIVCHNETYKTNNLSEICKIKFTDHSDIEVIKTNFSCAHNYLPYKDSFLICDSFNQKVFNGFEEFISLDGFTRGLLIDNEHLIIGVSEKKQKLKSSNQSKIVIYLLNQKKIIDQIIINTQIFDIIKSPIK